MDKIYVISTCWCGILESTMEHFYTPDKAVMRISEIASENGFRKAYPWENPQQYLWDYEDRLSENGIPTDIVMSLHIIDLKKEVSHA